ncbi:MAG: hypothetical protein FJ303_14130 [Planctomycetes bacterium]|nr:hypothetical protein [Planctomycetota bacterium]
MDESRISPIVGSPTMRAVLLAVAYFLSAELGHWLSLKSRDQVFATFWPPAGLLLAVLVLNRIADWPTFLFTACLANLASDVVFHEKPVPVSAGYCVANLTEACIGAWLLRRFGNSPLALTRVNDVLALAGMSALFSCAVGATIGAAVTVAAFDGVSFWPAWWMWWVSDAVGILVAAPVVLTWVNEYEALFADFALERVVEGVALSTGICAMAQAIFGGLLPTSLSVPIFILPFFVWSGLRFSPAVCATVILAVGLIGVANTAHGRGPYILLTDDARLQVLRSQATLSVISLCVLALAATVAERREVERQKTQLIGELEQAVNEIKTLRGLIPLCAWCRKIRNDQGLWQRIEDYLRAHTDARVSHGICPECLEKQLATIPDTRV